MIGKDVQVYNRKARVTLTSGFIARIVFNGDDHKLVLSKECINNGDIVWLEDMKNADGSMPFPKTDGI